MTHDAHIDTDEEIEAEASWIEHAHINEPRSSPGRDIAAMLRRLKERMNEGETALRKTIDQRDQCKLALSKLTHEEIDARGSHVRASGEAPE